MTFDQAEFEIRCEWGEQGIASLAPISDVVIIVDILSLSTCVDIAVSQAATVFPYRWKDGSAVHFAASVGAELAGEKRGGPGFSPRLMNRKPVGPADQNQLQWHTHEQIPWSHAKDAKKQGFHTVCRLVRRFRTVMGHELCSSIAAMACLNVGISR